MRQPQQHHNYRTHQQQRVQQNQPVKFMDEFDFEKANKEFQFSIGDIGEQLAGIELNGLFYFLYHQCRDM